MHSGSVSNSDNDIVDECGARAEKGTVNSPYCNSNAGFGGGIETFGEYDLCLAALLDRREVR